MIRLIEVIKKAQDIFALDLQKLSNAKGMTLDIYVRYLSFQHHLTKGVQKHFLAIAAHPTLAGRREFREFLFRFALEEEPHYNVAYHDLERLGKKPLACPLDVKLWWAYFDTVIAYRPFCRLGATCVLENLGAGAGALGHKLLDESPFLNQSNTKFLQIHFHETLPHGVQILDAIENACPTESEILDLLAGARAGATLYLRMARWAMFFDDPFEQVSQDEVVSGPVAVSCG